MSELEINPYAPAFIESMRAVGYSLETAIADLIDNSISASAGTVSIQFRPFNDPYVAIIDDGNGMTGDELTEAMRHGGKSPLDSRSSKDLGRFGLGLKTASLSQCRKLTVVTLKDGVLSARCWDLDVIDRKKAWILLAMDTQEEIRLLPHVDELLKRGKGTIVLWQALDRIAAGELSLDDALSSKMDLVRDHIAVVFHRYLGGETGLLRLRITINNNPVPPVDIFLSGHPATQRLRKDLIKVEGHPVVVQPYILPHISKLSPEELKLAGGEAGLRHNQGFYIYRNKRLINRGTWFRLARAEELTKLARVRVDIPNAVDHLWTLDIKKSSAYPPEVVRRNLARTVNRIAESSRNTYTFRGRKSRRDGIIHTWERVEGREGVSYRISRDHPILRALRDCLDDDQRRLLRLVLENIESTFPSDALYADLATDRRLEADLPNEEDLRAMVFELIGAAKKLPGGASAILDNLATLEPFSLSPEITAELVLEIRNAQ